jgi:hypothetical protein
MDSKESVVSTLAAKSRGIHARLCEALPVFLLVLLLLLTVVWWAPGMPYPGEDSAWVLAVNQAVADRLAFGRDVLFTVGPWGDVYAGQYHPATDTMMLAGGTLVALALGSGLAFLVHGRRRWIMLLFPLLVATTGEHDPVFIALPLLLLAVASARAGCRVQVAALLLLTTACALLSLVKGTFGTQAAMMVALAVLLLSAYRRLALAGSVLAAYVASVIGFWAWSGQILPDLPGYFLSMPVVISGYAEGLALDGPWSDIAAYLCGCSVLLWLLWRSRESDRRGATFVLSLGLAFTQFVAFKSGFVRHDEHALIAAGSLALMPFAIASALGLRHFAGAMFVSLLALAFISHHYPGYEWPRLGVGRDRLAFATEGAWTRWTDPGRLGRLYAKHMKAARLGLPLQHVTGPADIYSSGQMALLGNGLDWSPRPALQSVNVFTAALSQADLDHLDGTASGHPPVSNVFFRVENQDNRLPSTEDGLSWPSLLSAFHVAGFDRGLDTALLQRQPGAAAARPGPTLIDASHALGEEVALPPLPTGLAWATLDLRPTLAGRLAETLFRPPLLTITLKYANGPVDRFRLVSGLARAGFLIGPRVRSTADMLWLLLPDRRGPDQRPVSLTVSGESGTRWLWQQRFMVRIQALDIPLQNQVRALLEPSPMTRLETPATAAGTAQACTIDAINGLKPSAKPIVVPQITEVSGWAVVNVAGGEAPERVWVRLEDAAGHFWQAPAESRARLDVAGYFVNQGLAGSGFDARFDLSGLHGSFTMTVLAERNNAFKACSFRQQIITAAPAARSE